DRGARRTWLSDRVHGRRRQLRRHVRGRAVRGVARLHRRSALSSSNAEGVAMARVDDTFAPTRPRFQGPRLASSLRACGRHLVAWSPVIALLIAWEAMARSGLVTPFMLPTFSGVLERIASDTASGDLPIALGLTLWRALAGFFISAVFGIAL